MPGPLRTFERSEVNDRSRPMSPMLLGVVNAKNVDQYDILYFEFSITLAERQDVVFTSASANTEIPPDFYHDPASLAELDWDAIDSKKWGNPDDDFRHRRMAEMLVYGALPVTAAARCVVWNDWVKERVKEIVGDREFPPIEFEDRGRKHWFTNFAQGGTSSVVKGPGEVAGIFNDACAYVAEHTGDIGTPPVLRTFAASETACVSISAAYLILRNSLVYAPRTASIERQ